jgi:hypothetical protein
MCPSLLVAAQSVRMVPATTDESVRVLTWRRMMEGLPAVATLAFK